MGHFPATGLCPSIVPELASRQLCPQRCHLGMPWGDGLLLSPHPSMEGPHHHIGNPLPPPYLSGYPVRWEALKTVSGWPGPTTDRQASHSEIHLPQHSSAGIGLKVCATMPQWQFFFFFFKTKSSLVVLVHLVLKATLLPQPPKCWK